MGQSPASSSPGGPGLAEPECSPFCTAQLGAWWEILAEKGACSRALAKELLCIEAVNPGQGERGQRALQDLQGCHPTGKGS